MKSVLYARVSTEEQKNNQTIDTQIHGIGGMLQYAHNNKLPVPDESMIFIDDGFSGATLIRPALTALREYIKTHDDVGYFLVYDADRIGRDTYNQLIILEELKKKNITIHFKTGELGSTPNDKLLFTILSAFSEFERAKIMERTQRGMKRRIESGKFNGGRPLYGFKYNHTLGKHELDENEVKVARMMYDWYTEDKWNIRQIQSKLFELKIPSKYDGLKNTDKNKKLKGLKKLPMGWWSEATIRNILTNEAYTGRWYCGKNYTVKLEIPNPRTGKPKVRQFKRPKEEWFPIEIPRIISDEQYKKALLQARKNLMFAKRCTKQTYLLQGLIRCGKDGLKYRGHQEKSGVIYYYCKSRMGNNLAENCKSPYLRADQVEPIVWNTVKSFLENPEEIFNAFRNESILNEERVKSTQGRLDYIDIAIKKLETAKKRITEAFKAEAMTLQEFRKEKTDIELSEEKLVSERDGLMNKLNIQHNIEAKIDLFKETCHKFLSKINDQKIMTERLKKDIIKLVIDEVVIDGEKLKIFATIPLPNKIHEREIIKTDFPDTFNSGATLGPINQTKMERIWTKHKQINTTLKPKVFVGMSGGVDSSVALALLKERGWSPMGVSLKYSVWPFGAPRQARGKLTQDKAVSENMLRENACCSAESFRLAKEVCRRLGVPHRVVDVSKEFQKKVIDYFIKELEGGKTPNPCIICNRHLKFKKLFEVARKEKIEYVATGHYARALMNRATGEYQLAKSRDRKKDQTYSLCLLPQNWLRHIVFPLADYTKEKVFETAKKRGFDFYLKRKESQDFCFVANKCLNCFLEKEIGQKAGLIRDTNGNVLGQHPGLHFYTIGQRKGLYLPNGPYFVVNKDAKKNILAVSKSTKDLYGRGVILFPYNLIFGGKLRTKIEVMAKVRYSAPLAHAILRPLLGNKIELFFKKPQKAITPGQFAIFYKGNVCLGGGRIIKSIP